MNKEEQIIQDILNIKEDGQAYYFNIFQDGGAVCYMVNGWYLLFAIPLYGGKEGYCGTYHKSDVKNMVREALSWT